MQCICHEGHGHLEPHAGAGSLLNYTHTLRRNGRAGPRNTPAVIQTPYSTPDPELDSNLHRVLEA